jgi:hypothetical protein
MTELHTLQALAVAFVLTASAAIGVAVWTGRSVAGRIGRSLAVSALIGFMLFVAWPRGSPPPAAALKPVADRADRVPVEVVPGRSIGIPRALLSQLQKDLGTDESLPKTTERLAQQLTTEKLSLVDPRSATSDRRFPPDAEFYWLSGPAGFCGSGGCAARLYWVSPASAKTGKIFPSGDDDAFNKSPTVLRRSTNGLFDLELYQASGQVDGDHEPDVPLAFDGRQYVVQPVQPPANP